MITQRWQVPRCSVAPLLFFRVSLVYSRLSLPVLASLEFLVNAGVIVEGGGCYASLRHPSLFQNADRFSELEVLQLPFGDLLFVSAVTAFIHFLFFVITFGECLSDNCRWHHSSHIFDPLFFQDVLVSPYASGSIVVHLLDKPPALFTLPKHTPIIVYFKKRTYKHACAYIVMGSTWSIPTRIS